MIKKLYIKKISISLLAILLLLLMYIIPNNIKDLKVNKTEEFVNHIEEDYIFLLDSNNYLSMTSMYVGTYNNIESKAKSLIESLIIDGKNQDKIPNGFRAIIPSDTQILNVEYENGLIKVDFSKEFLDTNENLEEKMIESIVYTLTTIKDIKNILIYIEGELLTKLPKSNKFLPDILDRNYGINKDIDISNYKDILSFNVYYSNCYNENCYYVPVTKYINNTNKDKVKIIVDELSSSFSYDNNLMSFLNSNTQLIDYSFDNNVLKLEFNEYIADDFDTMSISENVKNCIKYSMMDLFDLNEIVFLVNNEEIDKSVIKTID